MTADHAAKITAIGTEWIAAATIVAALAAVATAIVAAYAAFNWQAGIKRERDDDVVGALAYCGSAIGRTIAFKLKNAHGQIWPAHEDAWASWRDFRRAYAVARSYRETLTNEAEEIEAGTAALESLADFCHDDAPSKQAGREINHAFGDFKAHISKNLGR